MKTFKFTSTRLVTACALALAMTSGAALAQNSLPAQDRSLITNSGNSGSQVWRNGYGECWHSGFGPAPAGPECNPNYRAPVAQAAPAPAPAPAPAQAVALPPPPPPAAPAPVATVAPSRVAVVEKVTLDADALFDFDKAVLRAEGRVMLDGFIGQLRGMELDRITAIGHADRFGSPSYNQSLSERRADAVKNYLVSGGVQSAHIESSGKGETQPMTKADDCRGPKSAKVVACLQPDRRVDVDVYGTRTVR